MRTYSIGHAALLSDIALRCGVICRGRDIDIAPRQQRFRRIRREKEKMTNSPEICQVFDDDHDQADDGRLDDERRDEGECDGDD
jgi:hypothetical protein